MATTSSVLEQLGKLIAEREAANPVAPTTTTTTTTTTRPTSTWTNRTWSASTSTSDVLRPVAKKPTTQAQTQAKAAPPKPKAPTTRPGTTTQRDNTTQRKMSSALRVGDDDEPGEYEVNGNDYSPYNPVIQATKLKPGDTLPAWIRFQMERKSNPPDAGFVARPNVPTYQQYEAGRAADQAAMQAQATDPGRTTSPFQAYRESQIAADKEAGTAQWWTTAGQALQTVFQQDDPVSAMQLPTGAYGGTGFTERIEKGSGVENPVLAVGQFFGPALTGIRDWLSIGAKGDMLSPYMTDEQATKALTPQTAAKPEGQTGNLPARIDEYATPLEMKPTTDYGDLSPSAVVGRVVEPYQYYDFAKLNASIAATNDPELKKWRQLATMRGFQGAPNALEDDLNIQYKYNIGKVKADADAIMQTEYVPLKQLAAQARAMNDYDTARTYEEQAAAAQQKASALYQNYNQWSSTPYHEIIDANEDWVLLMAQGIGLDPLNLVDAPLGALVGATGTWLKSLRPARKLAQAADLTKAVAQGVKMMDEMAPKGADEAASVVGRDLNWWQRMTQLTPESAAAEDAGNILQGLFYILKDIDNVADLDKVLTALVRNPETFVRRMPDGSFVQEGVTGLTSKALQSNGGRLVVSPKILLSPEMADNYKLMPRIVDEVLKSDVVQKSADGALDKFALFNELDKAAYHATRWNRGLQAIDDLPEGTAKYVVGKFTPTDALTPGMAVRTADDVAAVVQSVDPQTGAATLARLDSGEVTQAASNTVRRLDIAEGNQARRIVAGDVVRTADGAYHVVTDVKFYDQGSKVITVGAGDNARRFLDKDVTVLKPAKQVGERATIDFLDANGAVIGHSAQMSPQEARIYKKQLDRALKAGGSNPVTRFLNASLDVERSFLSDMYLNLRPGHWIRNAMSATAALMSDGIYSLEKTDDVLSMLMSKGVMSPRILEAATGITPGKIPHAYENLGGIGRRVAKASEAANRVWTGRLEMLGTIPFGEQAFYIKGFGKAFERSFREVWQDTAARTIAEWANQVGLDPRLTRDLINVAVEAGIRGGSNDVRRALTEVIMGRVQPFILRNLGVKDEVLSLQGEKQLAGIINEWLTSSPTPDPNDKNLRFAIDNLFAAEQGRYAALLRNAPPQRGNYIWTAQELKNDTSKMLDDYVSIATEAGIDRQVADQQAQAIVIPAIQAERQAWGEFYERLAGVEESAAMNVAFDLYARIDAIKQAARAQVDALMKPVRAAATPEERALAWQMKFAATNELYTRMAKDIQGVFDDAVMDVRKIEVGENVERKFDWSKVIDKYTSYDEQKVLEERAIELGSSTDTAPETWETVIAAQRAYVDQSFYEVYEAFRRFPSMETFDMLRSTQQQIDELGAKAAAYLAPIREKALAKNKTKTWEAYFRVRNALWRQTADEQVIYNRAATQAIVANGLSIEGSYDLRWRTTNIFDGDYTAAGEPAEYVLVGLSEDGLMTAYRTDTGETMQFALPGHKRALPMVPDNVREIVRNRLTLAASVRQRAPIDLSDANWTDTTGRTWQIIGYNPDRQIFRAVDAQGNSKLFAAEPGGLGLPEVPANVYASWQKLIGEDFDARIAAEAETLRAQAKAQNAPQQATAGAQQAPEAPQVQTPQSAQAEAPSPSTPAFAPGTQAVWRNADYDQPVTITGVLGEKDGVRYYSVEGTSTGIPETELFPSDMRPAFTPEQAAARGLPPDDGTDLADGAVGEPIAPKPIAPAPATMGGEPVVNAPGSVYANNFGTNPSPGDQIRRVRIPEDVAQRIRNGEMQTNYSDTPQLAETPDGITVENAADGVMGMGSTNIAWKDADGNEYRVWAVDGSDRASYDEYNINTYSFRVTMTAPDGTLLDGDVLAYMPGVRIPGQPGQYEVAQAFGMVGDDAAAQVDEPLTMAQAPVDDSLTMPPAQAAFVPNVTGGFDAKAWDAERQARIDASKAAGNKHLDDLPAYVETMRGKEIYYVHDPKVRGVVRTVDNRGSVLVNWLDDYSASKEMANPVKDGKKTVMQSTLGRGDLKDYVVAQTPTGGVDDITDTMPPSELPMSERTRRAIHATGNKLYGKQWNDQRHSLVSEITGGRETSTARGTTLTENEAAQILSRLNAEAAARADLPPEGERIADIVADHKQTADDLQVIKQVAEEQGADTAAIDEAIAEHSDSIIADVVKMEDEAAPPTMERIRPAQTDSIVRQRQEGTLSAVEPVVTDGMVTTLSGRRVSAPPQIRTTSDRAAPNDIRKVDEWLLTQARQEAASRNDEWNMQQFGYINPKKLTQADKDLLNEYLFGDPDPRWRVATAPAAPPAQALDDAAQAAPKEPWQMTKAEAQAYADKISTEADTYAKQQVSVEVEAKKLRDLEQQLQLERGKLSKLEAQSYNTFDADVMERLKKQKQKVKRLEDNYNRLSLERRDTSQRQSNVWLQYVEERYPEFVRTVDGQKYSNFGSYTTEWGEAIRKAHSEGKPIPQNVLDDYERMNAASVAAGARDRTLAAQAAPTPVTVTEYANGDTVLYNGQEVTVSGVSRSQATGRVKYDVVTADRQYIEDLTPDELQPVARQVEEAAAELNTPTIDGKPVVVWGKLKPRMFGDANVNRLSDMGDVWFNDTEIITSVDLSQKEANQVAKAVRGRTVQTDNGRYMVVRQAEQSEIPYRGGLESTELANVERAQSIDNVPQYAPGDRVQYVGADETWTGVVKSGNDQRIYEVMPDGEDYTLAIEGESLNRVQPPYTEPVASTATQTPLLNAFLSDTEIQTRLIEQRQQFDMRPEAFDLMFDKWYNANAKAVFGDTPIREVLQQKQAAKEQLRDAIQRFYTQADETSQQADALRTATSAEMDAAYLDERAAAQAQRPDFTMPAEEVQPIPLQELERLGLIQKQGDAWSWSATFAGREVPGGQSKWYAARNEAEAIEKASETYRKNPQWVSRFEQPAVAVDETALRAELAQLQEQRNAQYWAFTRQAKAKPVDAAITRRIGEIERQLGIAPDAPWKLTFERAQRNYNMNETAHRLQIEKALQRGDAVPPEVLDEYPDLAAKYAPQAAPTFTVSPDDVDYKRAYAAFAGSSFTPERGATRIQSDYASHMTNLYQSLSNYAKTDADQETLLREMERYRDGYLKRLYAWLDADARTVSSMITGSSNFPVARNAKRLETAQKRLNEFVEWQDKAQRAIFNELTGAGGIRSDSPTAIADLQKKLDAAERLQEMMKAANKVVKGKGTDDEKIAKMVDLGFTDAEAREALKPDFIGRTGFPDYKLQNNNAEIKRVQNRIAQLEKLSDVRGETAEWAFEGGRVVDNVEEGRVQVIFNERISKEQHEKMRHAGFVYSRKNQAYQRGRLNARRSVFDMTGIDLNKPPIVEQVAEQVDDFQPITGVSEALTREDDVAQAAPAQKLTKNQAQAKVRELGGENVALEFSRWQKNNPDADYNFVLGVYEYLIKQPQYSSMYDGQRVALNVAMLYKNADEMRNAWRTYDLSDEAKAANDRILAAVAPQQAAPARWEPANLTQTTVEKYVAAGATPEQLQRLDAAISAGDTEAANVVRREVIGNLDAQTAEAIFIRGELDAATPRIPREELERVDLIRRWGDKWQYRTQPGGKWFYANSEEGAIETATETYRRTSPDDLLTPAERFDKAEAARFAEWDSRHGRNSLSELKAMMDRASGGTYNFREMTGTGDRRTAAAVNNQGLRDAGEFRLQMNIYLEERVKRALANGETVPDDVLAMYPDLQRAAATQTAPSNTMLRTPYEQAQAERAQVGESPQLPIFTGEAYEPMQVYNGSLTKPRNEQEYRGAVTSLNDALQDMDDAYYVRGDIGRDAYYQGVKEIENALSELKASDPITDFTTAFNEWVLRDVEMPPGKHTWINNEAYRWIATSDEAYSVGAKPNTFTPYIVLNSKTGKFEIRQEIEGYTGEGLPAFKKLAEFDDIGEAQKAGDTIIDEQYATLPMNQPGEWEELRPPVEQPAPEPVRPTAPQPTFMNKKGEPRQVWASIQNAKRAADDLRIKAEGRRSEKLKQQDIERAKARDALYDVEMQKFATWVADNPEAAVEQLGWTRGKVDALAGMARLSKRGEWKSRMGAGEFAWEQYQKQFDADPNKWKVGMGVGWRVSRDQINKGYRIVAVDRDAMIATIRPVRDTGLTRTGGDFDRFDNEQIRFGDLSRVKADDGNIVDDIAPEVTQAPAPQPAPVAQAAEVAQAATEPVAETVQAVAPTVEIAAPQAAAVADLPFADRTPHSSKMPWRMTKDEWDQERAALDTWTADVERRSKNEEALLPGEWNTLQQRQSEIGRNYQSAVIGGIRRGQIVPPNVLRQLEQTGLEHNYVSALYRSYQIPRNGEEALGKRIAQAEVELYGLEHEIRTSPNAQASGWRMSKQHDIATVQKKLDELNARLQMEHRQYNAPADVLNDTARVGVNGMTTKQSTWVADQLKQAEKDLKAGKVASVTVNIPNDGQLISVEPKQAATQYQALTGKALPGYDKVDMNTFSGSASIPEYAGVARTSGNRSYGQMIADYEELTPNQVITAPGQKVQPNADELSRAAKVTFTNKDTIRKSTGEEFLAVNEVDGAQWWSDGHAVFSSDVPKVFAGIDPSQPDIAAVFPKKGTDTVRLMPVGETALGKTPTVVLMNDEGAAVTIQTKYYAEVMRIAEGMATGKGKATKIPEVIWTKPPGVHRPILASINGKRVALIMPIGDEARALTETAARYLSPVPEMVDFASTTPRFQAPAGAKPIDWRLMFGQRRLENVRKKAKELGDQMRATWGKPKDPEIGNVAVHQVSTLADAKQRVLDSLPNIATQPKGGINASAQRFLLNNIDKSLVNKFDDSVMVASEAARNAADGAMLNYQRRRGFDVALGKIYPYHYFWTRGTYTWAKRLARKPSLANLLYETQRAIDMTYQREGLPERLDGTLMVHRDDKGQLRLRNPIEYVMPSLIYGGGSFYNPEDGNNAYERAMLSLKRWTPGFFPHVDIMLSALFDAAYPLADGSRRTEQYMAARRYVPIMGIASDMTMASGNDPLSTIAGGDKWDQYRIRRTAAVMLEEGEFGQGFDAQQATRYANQISANLELGQERYTDIPEEWQERAEEVYKQAAARAGQERLYASAGSMFAGNSAYYYPDAEADLKQQQAAYSAAGFSEANPAGSSAQKKQVLEDNPNLPVWWTKNIEGDKTPAQSAKDAQMWQDLGAQVYAPREREIAIAIAQNVGDKEAQLEAIRAIDDKYDAAANAIFDEYEYQSSGDASTPTGADPYEAARASLENMLNYDAPYPVKPEKFESNAQKNAYYKEQNKWYADRVVAIENRIAQVFDMYRENPDNLVVKQLVGILEGMDVDALIREYATLKHATPDEAALLREDSIVKQQDREQRAAGMEAVGSILGEEWVNRYNNYLDLEDDDRKLARDQYPQISAINLIVNNFDKYQELVDIFGEEAFQAWANRPAKDDEEAWDTYYSEHRDAWLVSAWLNGRPRGETGEEATRVIDLDNPGGDAVAVDYYNFGKDYQTAIEKFGEDIWEIAANYSSKWSKKQKAQYFDKYPQLDKFYDWWYGLLDDDNQQSKYTGYRSSYRRSYYPRRSYYRRSYGGYSRGYSSGYGGYSSGGGYTPKVYPPDVYAREFDRNLQVNYPSYAWEPRTGWNRYWTEAGDTNNRRSVEYWRPRTNFANKSRW